MPRTILAFGCNLPSYWGSTTATLHHALRCVQEAGFVIRSISAVYETTPIGSSRQPNYLNAVAICDVMLPPAEMLRRLKRIERSAGRRVARGPGARPLDLDIVDVAGWRLGWPPRARLRGGLILPHPLAHRRAFVLVPLVDVAPGWQHCILQRSARQLLARLPRNGHRVTRIDISSWPTRPDPDRRRQQSP